MKKILLLDAENYDPALPEIRRTAVRGIIFDRGKLLLIHASAGEVKFPGGGQEDGETDLETLARETLEETGYHILPESARAFGEVEEKRLSIHADEAKIWRQISRYYFCDIRTDVKDACRYTENEKNFGFRQVWYPLDEAIRLNREMLQKEGAHAWNQREFRVLQLLKEYLNQTGREQP